MSFADTAVLFVLALLLFGPKKLPGIARQIGKLLNEFKRASNEFKAQIESEINQMEFQEKQKARAQENLQAVKEEEQKILPPIAPPAESIPASRSQAESGQALPEPPAPAEQVNEFHPSASSSEADTIAASNPSNG